MTDHRRKARRNWDRDISVTRQLLDGKTLGQIGVPMGLTRERIRTMVQRTIDAMHEVSGYHADPRWQYRKPHEMRDERAFWNRQLDKLEARHTVVGFDPAHDEDDSCTIVADISHGIVNVRSISHGR